MELLDLTLPTPAENLACDEALLDAAEACECGELLRFWEPRQYFVVVGYANRVATEVNVSACERAGAPIQRRCSGGGTVLQGPGCLNYALILRIQGDPPLNTISEANQFIMDRNRAAMELLLNHPITIEGHTDLAMNGLKFSGNSQRRRRHFILFHGTFLCGLEIARVEALLQPPSKQPDYRRGRSHREFLVNLKVCGIDLKSALKAAWQATYPLNNVPHLRIQQLAREKYATPDWTRKF